MIGAQNALVIRAGLLVELQRGSHSARRVKGGAEATADRDRVQMGATKDALPFGQNPFIKGQSILDLAIGQVGAGQLLAGGYSVGMPWSLNALAVGPVARWD